MNESGGLVEPMWTAFFDETVRHDASREGKEERKENVKTKLSMFSKHDVEVLVEQ